jgi:hypothetical protein
MSATYHHPETEPTMEHTTTRPALPSAVHYKIPGGFHIAALAARLGRTPGELEHILQVPDAADLLRLACHQTYRSEGIQMTVFMRINLHGFDIETHTDDGCDEIVATSDGRSYRGAWHDGPVSDDEPVRVERWTAAGRTFHGFIDPESRKLVQAG